MTVLLASATAIEIAPLLAAYGQSGESWIPEGELDILITGVGLTATVYNLQRQIGLKRPDLVIQAGAGGCFDEKRELGQVVRIERDTIADQGVLEQDGWKTIFDLGLKGADEFPYRDGWLLNNSMLGRQFLETPSVRGITVNQVTVSEKMMEAYRSKFDPVIESMEGAALHYVCRMENLPFMQYRAISNRVGERDKKNWRMKEAIAQLNEQMIKLIQTF